MIFYLLQTVIICCVKSNVLVVTQYQQGVFQLVVECIASVKQDLQSSIITWIDVMVIEDLTRMVIPYEI